MANDLAKLRAATERHKRHNDRVERELKGSGVTPIDLFAAPTTERTEERCSKCTHWRRGMFGTNPCPAGGEHSWVLYSVPDSPVGVMTGAQAVALMTGDGKKSHIQRELETVVSQLELHEKMIQNSLTVCRALLEKVKEGLL